jgi:hypothetical protein
LRQGFLITGPRLARSTISCFYVVIVRSGPPRINPLASALRLCSSAPIGLKGCDPGLDGQLFLLPTKPRDGPAANAKEKIMSNNKQSSRKPSHRIYIVTGEGDDAQWQEVGAAWPNRDGKGYSISAKNLPLRIVMREATERPAKKATTSSAE